MEQKFNTQAIPVEYQQLINKIEDAASGDYTFETFKQEIKTFFEKTDLLYIDPVILGSVLSYSDNPKIKGFLYTITTKYFGFNAFMYNLTKEVKPISSINIRKMSDAFREEKPQEEILAIVSPLVENFYRTTNRLLTEETEKTILQEFIKLCLPPNTKNPTYYFDKLSPIITQEIQKRQGGSLEPTPQIPTDLTSTQRVDAQILAAKARLKYEAETKQPGTKHPSPTDLSLIPTFIPENNPTTTPFPSYCSSFWSFVTNNNIKTKEGKFAYKASSRLLIADLLITGVGGVLYGVSNNRSNQKLVNDLHNFISDHSEALKLCAEIIPPALLFLSLIILSVGIKKERDSLQSGVQDLQQSFPSQPAS